MTILALFILSVATNVWLIKRGQVEPEPQVVIEHDTLWRDTIINKPVAADSTKTGEVVYIKVPYPMPSGCQSDGCQGTVPWQDSAKVQSPDSLEIPIHIEQKRYEDSLYTAWVSGYQPEYGLPAIFTEVNGSESAARTLTRETGTQAFPLSMIMSGAGCGIRPYIDAMNSNYDTILAALGG